MHAHRHKARNDDNCRQDEKSSFAQGNRLPLSLLHGHKFLIADTHRIKCVQDQLGYNQRSKQGNDDTERQGLGKSP